MLSGEFDNVSYNPGRDIREARLGESKTISVLSSSYPCMCEIDEQYVNWQISLSGKFSTIDLAIKYIHNYVALVHKLTRKKSFLSFCLNLPNHYTGHSTSGVIVLCTSEILP